jgi:hypothetical protein
MTESTFRKFAPFWAKYRTAVLKMMQASSSEAPQYQLMSHELRDIEKKPKGGFEFRLVISEGKATRETTDSEIAKDLLSVLQLSKTASTLMAANRYEITLDRKQTLRVTRQSLDEPTVV